MGENVYIPFNLKNKSIPDLANVMRHNEDIIFVCRIVMIFHRGKVSY